MSYDYVFFRLRRPIADHTELSEEATAPIGSGDAIAARLAELFPDLVWDPPGEVARGTGADNDGGWYELSFNRGPAEVVLHLRTSHRSPSRPPPVLVRICASMGLVAFDAQTCELHGSLEP